MIRAMSPMSPCPPAERRRTCTAQRLVVMCARVVIFVVQLGHAHLLVATTSASLAPALVRVTFRACLAALATSPTGAVALLARVGASSLRPARKQPALCARDQAAHQNGCAHHQHCASLCTPTSTCSSRLGSIALAAQLGVIAAALVEVLPIRRLNVQYALPVCIPPSGRQIIHLPFGWWRW